jgi:hypothetical protein
MDVHKIAAAIQKDQERSAREKASELFSELIQKDQYIGDIYAINYESATVQIHDAHRKKVGGIPSLSFLIATRINPEQQVDYTLEDTCIILLRVMDATATPNSGEAERIRFESAQKISGDEKHWDETGAMDSNTAHLLSFAAVKCRVIGTFYVDKRNDEAPEEDVILRFGSDLSNYYPNRGLKVYKPNAAALRRIVNYRDQSRSDQLADVFVNVGDVRYASTNRSFQDVSNVEVRLNPSDLLRQKTALFGMTRTGKSNTTKVILQSVFNLRFDQKTPLRIGQIVFDPNGEYANENVQDNTAIKNVGKQPDGSLKEVVTYGITTHPNDEHRKLMLLNFYLDQNLQIGKEIIDSALSADGSKYIQNFRQVIISVPDENDRSGSAVRLKRRVLVYRALLANAGFIPPNSNKPQVKGLFNKELLEAMETSQSKNNATSHKSAAKILTGDNPTWQQVATALSGLEDFMSTDDYKKFDETYVQKSSTGETWADEDLKKLLTMFKYPNGVKQIGQVIPQHSESTTTDFADDIYNDLVAGNLVIVDQSSGDPTINKSSADRIMWYIFRKQQDLFRRGESPHEILVYVEEAHNLLPAGSDMDLENVWVRTAKEGAKYRIGMVYATQEVSSIQRNILKNTANWFIGHLNNTDETKELCKYYDFEDFEPSIRRAQDRGFMRVKTLSNLFVVPVQVKKFEVL